VVASDVKASEAVGDLRQIGVRLLVCRRAVSGK